jgi:hypothetical protein
MSTMVCKQMGLFEEATVDEDARWLEHYLEATGRWHSAADLALAHGEEDGDVGRRWIRSLAQMSDRVISGQRGYKHVRHATAEEVEHFVNWMESQGKKMISRAERTRQVKAAIQEPTSEGVVA